MSISSSFLISQLAASYSHAANFVTVYLSEAHPSDLAEFKGLYVDIEQHK